jgi:hypothetical protein
MVLFWIGVLIAFPPAMLVGAVGAILLLTDDKEDALRRLGGEEAVQKWKDGGRK